MNRLLLFSICIIPILFLLWYVYVKDKVEKEPLYLLFLLFVAGIFSCIFSILISTLLKQYIIFLNWTYNDMSTWQIIFKVLVSVALVEEGIKWLFNYILIWRNDNFNHIYDPIVYAVFVSLGFALVENIMYAIAFENYGFIPVIMRGFISVPCHAVFGIYMGYYLGISKNSLVNKKERQSQKYKLLSIIVPIFLHFIYNILLIRTGLIVYIVFIAYLIFLYVSSYIIIKKLSFVKKMLN